MICNRSTRRGVSLIEAVMVIVLLSAAAVTSSVMLDGQWVAKRSVTGVTDEIAQTLNAARNTAITNQAIIRVRRIRSGGIEQLVITEEAGPFGPGNLRTVELGSDVRVRGTPRQVRFNPTGTANRGTTWTIRKSRSSGAVNVSPSDGQVTRTYP